MRYKRTLLLLVMLMAVLPLAQAAWADSGTAPAWSPDMGSPPILPPWDASNVVDMKGASQVTKEIITAPLPPTAISPGPGDVSRVPWDDNLPLVTMPLVYGDSGYATPGAAAVQEGTPMLPPITLVETPHDGWGMAIEVPDGGTVLVDGTVATCGMGTGSSGIGFIQPPPPPPLPDNWDSLAFNAPILPGP